MNPVHSWRQWKRGTWLKKDERNQVFCLLQKETPETTASAQDISLDTALNLYPEYSTFSFRVTTCT
jgi:hypothetical protein